MTGSPWLFTLRRYPNPNDSDRMKALRWLAAAITLAWVIQVHVLWPLPNQAAAQVAAQIAAELGPSISTLPASALDDLNASIWVSWFIWAAVVPIGVLSGILALLNRPRWSWVFLVASSAYLVILCPWRLAYAIHAHAFRSFAIFVQHWSWVLTRPSLTFMTVVFPLFIIAVSIYSAWAITIGKRRRAT